MPATLAIPPSWSPRRWIAVIGGLVLLQVAVLVLLSQRILPSPRVDASRTVIHLDSGTPAVGAVEPSLASDPTLFALMNRRGFSGRAWLDFSSQQHTLNDWQEPPVWLAPEAARFGEEFQRYATSNVLNHLLLEDKPAPRANPPTVPNIEAPSKSMLLVGRELAGRALLASPDLPAWPHTDLLGDSVVQVVVNAAGDPLSARLLNSCGHLPADQRALEVAQALRFAPVPGGQRERADSWASLTTANLVFRWRTLAPKAAPEAKDPLP